MIQLINKFIKVVAIQFFIYPSTQFGQVPTQKVPTYEVQIEKNKFPLKLGQNVIPHHLKYIASYTTMQASEINSVSGIEIFKELEKNIYSYELSRTNKNNKSTFLKAFESVENYLLVETLTEDRIPYSLLHRLDWNSPAILLGQIDAIKLKHSGEFESDPIWNVERDRIGNYKMKAQKFGWSSLEKLALEKPMPKSFEYRLFQSLKNQYEEDVKYLNSMKNINESEKGITDAFVVHIRSWDIENIFLTTDTVILIYKIGNSGLKTLSRSYAINRLRDIGWVTRMFMGFLTGGGLKDNLISTKNIMGCYAEIENAIKNENSSNIESLINKINNSTEKILDKSLIIDHVVNAYSHFVMCQGVR